MQEYLVGFRIFEGRNLQSEDGNPCDPFVVVDCGGFSYQTETLEARGSLAPWNEHSTWPHIWLHPKEFDSSFVEFKVYARHWFTRNYLIGKATLQLSYINKRQHHLCARRSLQLRRDESPAVAGTLTVTVFVLKPGEMAPSLALQTSEPVDVGDEGQVKQSDQDGLETAVLSKNVDAQPGRPHYLRLNLFRVEDLPDENGAPSPYLTAEFAGCLVKTAIGKNAKQFTFNECLQIPVVTPVYEDTIILKLWSSNWFSPDELMAQGLFSFSELRSHPLPPRWFNLYGWAAEELAEMERSGMGEKEPEANVFKGRLLLSALVHPLENDEEFHPAKSVPTRPEMEPSLSQIGILADVYMVSGADGRQCQVEVSFGPKSGSTKWVSSSERLQDPSEGQDEFEDDHVEGEDEGLQSFGFNEKSGRIEMMVVMAPEDPNSQSSLTISLYTSGYLHGPRRVAATKCSLSEFLECHPEEQVKPRSISLESVSHEVSSPSVLIAIKKTRNFTAPRNARKPVQPMVYLLRAYCFTARSIKHSNIRNDQDTASFGLTVSCTGMSKRTKAVAGPRPMWMQPLEVKILLCSDSTREAPATEPINVTLWQQGQVMSSDVGKATCIYSHMRKRDVTGRWEPFYLSPQWIKLYGEQGSSRHVGSLLIGFELLLFKHRHEPFLAAKDMWPHSKETYDQRHHLCRLRKATLHFSLLGLRDVAPLPRVEALGSAGGTVHAEKPSVTVEVVQFVAPEEQKDAGKARKLEFHFGEAHQDPAKMKRMKPWVSTIHAGSGRAKNFDFLEAGKLQCLLPEKGVLEPYLVIRVSEAPSAVGASLGYEPYSVGEALVSLEDRRPCCWFEGISLNKSYASQQGLLAQAANKSHGQALDKEKYQEETEEELRREILRRRSAAARRGAPKEVAVQDALQAPSDVAFLDPAGVPEPLRNAVRRPMALSCKEINMQNPSSFSPRPGAKIKSIAARSVVDGALEDSADGTFDTSDFWYKSLRLAKNEDVMSGNDWHFRAACAGFVKCAFKLVDGWENVQQEGEDALNDEEDSEGEEEEDLSPTHQVLEDVKAVESRGDILRLKSSYGLDPILDGFAFSTETLYQRYRDPEHVPPRIRARLYLVKAILIGAAGENPDPFLEIQLGRETNIQMRNMVQMGTTTPDFHRMEARDIQMPEDSRLEVTVRSLQDLALQDPILGGTVIDLEDRWHSGAWQKANRVQMVPVENRPLFSKEQPGKSCGTLEMWVEMIESSEAANMKPSALVKPPQLELEARLVIWSTDRVKLMNEEATNIRIKTQLDCKEYIGNYQALQETDVHFNSKDGKGVFNWRMVYPRIKMPTWSCTLTVGLYHSEMLSDTFLGSFDLDLKKYLERVARDSDAVTVGPSDLSCFNDEEEVGSVNMTLYVLTQAEAHGRRVGIAREEPNENPQLLTPTEGRDWGTYLSAFGFAWPDFGLWKKLVPLMIAMVIFLVAIIFLRQVGIL